VNEGSAVRTYAPGLLAKAAGAGVVISLLAVLPMAATSAASTHSSTTVARNAPAPKGPKLIKLKITKGAIPSIISPAATSCTYNPKTHALSAGGAVSWVPSGGGGALGTVSVVWSSPPKKTASHKKGAPAQTVYSVPAASQQFFSGLWSLSGTWAPPKGTKTPPATCALTLNFAAPTAESVESYLAAKGLPITGVVAFDASTDPNHLLGRPNGYLSKVAWQDPRIPQTNQSSDPGGIEWGGGIEVFPTAAAATARASYISSIGQSSSFLANEYDYVLGPIFMRITGTFIPTTADGYRSALTGSTLYTPTPPGAATTTTAP
jgi:hypothetical protein